MPNDADTADQGASDLRADAEAQALERLATQLESRGGDRDEDPEADDEDSQCDGLCGNADCHRVSAVATWHRAALVARRAAEAVRASVHSERTVTEGRP